MNKPILHHICIQTSCYEASLAFYTKLIGFKVVQETANFHGRAYNTWLKLDDFYIELQTAKVGKVFKAYDKESDGIVHLCFYAEDLDAIYEQCQALGYDDFCKKGDQIIYQVHQSRLLKLKAPEGTIIEWRDQMALE